MKFITHIFTYFLNLNRPTIFSLKQTKSFVHQKRPCPDQNLIKKNTFYLNVLAYILQKSFVCQKLRFILIQTIKMCGITCRIRTFFDNKPEFLVSKHRLKLQNLLFNQKRYEMKTINKFFV